MARASKGRQGRLSSTENIWFECRHMTSLLSLNREGCGRNSLKDSAKHKVTGSFLPRKICWAFESSLNWKNRSTSAKCTNILGNSKNFKHLRKRVYINLATLSTNFKEIVIFSINSFKFWGACWTIRQLAEIREKPEKYVALFWAVY